MIIDEVPERDPFECDVRAWMFASVSNVGERAGSVMSVPRIAIVLNK